VTFPREMKEDALRCWQTHSLADGGSRESSFIYEECVIPNLFLGVAFSLWMSGYMAMLVLPIQISISRMRFISRCITCSL
jgi:hypothetical protein